MNVVHTQRKVVAGQPIDVIVVSDEDFRALMINGSKAFIREHQQQEVPVVLVGCPSLTSVVPEGVNFSLSTLRGICQNI